MMVSGSDMTVDVIVRRLGISSVEALMRLDASRVCWFANLDRCP